MNHRTVAIGLTALLPMVALATVVKTQSFEEMARVAPVVVRATVKSNQAAFGPEDHSIWTYTELALLDAMKGAAPSVLVVKQPGGVVGREGTRVEGTAKFAAGEEVILFLEPSPDEPGRWVVLGLAAGKVSLETVRGERVAIRRTEGLGFADPSAKHIKRLDPVENLGPADAFIARVKKAIRASGGTR